MFRNQSLQQWNVEWRETPQNDSEARWSSRACLEADLRSAGAGKRRALTRDTCDAGEASHEVAEAHIWSASRRARARKGSRSRRHTSRVGEGSAKDVWRSHRALGIPP